MKLFTQIGAELDAVAEKAVNAMGEAAKRIEEAVKTHVEKAESHDTRAVFYVGEDCEIEESWKLCPIDTKSEPRPHILARGDRIAFVSGNAFFVTIECRHKLTSGDIRKDVLFISSEEFLDLVRMATHDWKDQGKLATLHKQQGHA